MLSLRQRAHNDKDWVLGFSPFLSLLDSEKISFPDMSDIVPKGNCQKGYFSVTRRFWVKSQLTQMQDFSRNVSNY